MITRRTEVLTEIERWIDHFEEAKQDQIHLVELEPESLDVTWWYHEFLNEIDQLSADDKVFTST